MSLFSKIRDVIHQGRDHSAAMLVKRLIQDRFANYGVVEHLSIDSRQKQIRVILNLRGDPEPISVHINPYEVVQNGSDYSVVIRDASASKEWLRQAINDFVINRPFSIPPKYASLAVKLL